MTLRHSPELAQFLATYFSDGEQELEADTAAVLAFLSSASEDLKESVISQLQNYLVDAREVMVDELGAEANRWFGEAQEASVWLKQILQTLERDSSRGSSDVKDSFGALLAEGDAVQVIKDLKVKGGSSDLKRGTLIKKIHLIGDPAAVECKVDGSTLVLKTCFLKKI